MARDRASVGRAWIGHGIVVALLVAAHLWWVPRLERAFKDMGGALPGPTQLLLDLSRDVRRGPGYLPLWLALAFFLYRWFAALAGLRRERARRLGALPGLVNAGLVLYLLFVVLAAMLPLVNPGVVR